MFCFSFELLSVCIHFSLLQRPFTFRNNRIESAQKLFLVHSGGMRRDNSCMLVKLYRNEKNENRMKWINSYELELVYVYANVINNKYWVNKLIYTPSADSYENNEPNWSSG